MIALVILGLFAVVHAQFQFRFNTGGEQQGEEKESEDDVIERLREEQKVWWANLDQGRWLCRCGSIFALTTNIR